MEKPTCPEQFLAGTTNEQGRDSFKHQEVLAPLNLWYDSKLQLQQSEKNNYYSTCTCITDTKSQIQMVKNTHKQTPM